MADHDDVVTNVSSNPDIQSIIARRMVLKGGAGLAAVSLFGALSGCGSESNSLSTVPTIGAGGASGATPSRVATLGFSAVAKSVSDAIVLPNGYYATVLLRLGDPIKAGTSFYRNDGSDPGATYDARIGDHGDAIDYFGLGADGKYSPSSTNRGLLVQNHEAITPIFLHRNGPTVVNGARTVAEEVLKEFYVHAYR